MEQRLGALDPTCQAAGEAFDEFIATVLDAKAHHDFLHALAKNSPRESVEVPLRAEILADSQRFVQALRLEHDTDTPPHFGRLLDDIAACHLGSAFGWDHHCRENAEESGF